MSQEILLLSDKLVKYAKSKGADQVQISVTESKDFNVEVREGNIEKLTETLVKSMSIKVIVDKKIASASSSDFKITSLENLIENSIKRAKLSGKDEFAELPPFTKFNQYVDLGVFSQDVFDLSSEAKINFAKELEKIGISDKKITKSGGSSFGTSIVSRYLTNSNGFLGNYKKSYCSAGVGLQGGTDDKMIEDGWWESSLSYIDLPRPEIIAKKAIERVTRLLGAKKIKSENLSIVFDSTVASSLMGFLASCLNGNSIYLKTSFLSGKLNEKIAFDRLNIIDDGMMPKCIGSVPFDSEGNPTKKNSIIENGILKSYLLDHYSAKKLNLASTGNAGGVHNFYVSPGKFTQKEMFDTIDKGLFITKTIGQGTVPTTGDISKGAYGIMIEKGELTYPVSEVTFSSNLGTMLKNIEMIGNDLKLRSSVNSPSLKINDITIGGE